MSEHRSDSSAPHPHSADRLKFQVRQPTPRKQGRALQASDLSIKATLRPNKEHPLADLSPAGREELRFRDFARILADIALRQSQPRESSREDQPA
jgi:hypothetical protein